jgi:hypothetical protein
MNLIISLLLFIQTVQITIPSQQVAVPIPNYVQNVCSGSLTLGTAPIPSGGQATIVTANCPTLLTTDVISASSNVNIFTVVGYVPSTNGILTINVFPTAGQVNVAVANNTGKAIIPALLTLNYKVTR